MPAIGLRLTGAGPAPWLRLVLPGAAGGARFAGFGLARLQPGQDVDLPAGLEAVIVPLRGGLVAGGLHLQGRSDPGAGATDCAYLPPGAWTLHAGSGPVDVAVGLAPPAGGGRAPRRVDAAEVGIEERGAGTAARTVRHLYEGDRPADRLLVVEVLTPPGHWSSFPPHRHDGLEEFYYCETRPAGRWAYLHAFDDRGADEAVAVGDGDLCLVCAGYHTAATPPGTALYYLNVMAGPDRAWRPEFHPAYRDQVVGWERAPITR